MDYKTDPLSIGIDALAGKFLCLKLRGHWAEYRQISRRCTEIIAEYSSEIKIVILQSVVKLRMNRGNLAKRAK